MEKTKLQEKVNAINKLIVEEYGKDSNSDYVISDGIVDIEKYLDSKFKILWILKEPHDKGENGKWDMRDLLKNYSKQEGKLNPNMRFTFRRIIYSTYGILNDFTNFDEMHDYNADFMIDILKSIALINIRKLPGGNTSNDKEIRDAYQNYKSIILKQIEIFKPDVIIGGNTIQYLKNDLGLANLEYIGNYPTDYYLSKDKIIIDAYHPGATSGNPDYGSVTDSGYVNTIIEAVKDWSEKNK